MPVSNFSLLMGRSGAYDGEGFEPDYIMFLRPEKGMWIVNEPNVRWICYDPDHIFPDALLIMSLILLNHANGLLDSESGKQLLQAGSEYFDCDLESFVLGETQRNIHDNDLLDNFCETRKKQTQQLQELYSLNKEVISNTNAKLVALDVGGSPVRKRKFMEEEDMENTTRQDFITTVKNFGLKDAEYCESTYRRFYSAFGNEQIEEDPYQSYQE